MFSARLAGVVFLLVAIFTTKLHADEAGVVKQTVEQNVAQILATFEAEKEGYETNPEVFYANMEKAISGIIDFRRIAARVMGKYAKRADKDQRNRFVEAFKSSLFQTYTRAIIEQGSFNMKVVKATINPRSDKRASVDMEVITQSGNVYPVTYSMYKNKSDQWLMENVIVFGINIGLAFRDKFEAQMRLRKGDVDEVIANWSVDLDIDVDEVVASQAEVQEG